MNQVTKYLKNKQLASNLKTLRQTRLYLKITPEGLAGLLARLVDRKELRYVLLGPDQIVYLTHAPGAPLALLLLPPFTDDSLPWIPLVVGYLQAQGESIKQNFTPRDHAWWDLWWSNYLAAGERQPNGAITASYQPD